MEGGMKMPDRKLLARIEKLGADIDSCADALRKLKIGCPEWMKTNNRLFNLIAKRDRLLEEAKRAAG
jgi:hypothetical protein